MAKIGASYATLDTFAALGVSAPIEKPVVPYSVVRTQDGGALGVGWASAVLEWPFLPNAERALLRTIIAGASASVYVELPSETYTPTVYTGIALWPELRPENSQRARFELRIVKLVVYTP